jgi:hypothetical protein
VIDNDPDIAEVRVGFTASDNGTHTAARLPPRPVVDDMAPAELRDERPDALRTGIDAIVKTLQEHRANSTRRYGGPWEGSYKNPVREGVDKGLCLALRLLGHEPPEERR